MESWRQMGASGTSGDLKVPWDRGTLVGLRIAPDRVVRALAQHLAAVFGQIPLKVAALQAAAMSIVTRST
jgi:hypothetical protein